MIETGFAHFVQQLDPLGWSLLIILALLSLASWTFFLLWLLRSLLELRSSQHYMHKILESTGLAEPSGEPYGRPFEASLLAVVLDGRRLADAGERFDEAGGLAAHLIRGLRQQLDRAAVRGERGLALLSTTASTAPYLGLLGTVWGIYHALLRIAATGEAGLSAVAGPIGEALVMTALGLAVAIPAVFAHNILQRRHRLLQARREDFATTLLQRATLPGSPSGAIKRERAAIHPLRS